MERNAETGLSRKKTYLLAAAALMTALTCILAPLSIPIGPVPIALTNLVIYLSLYLLGGSGGRPAAWPICCLGRRACGVCRLYRRTGHPDGEHRRLSGGLHPHGRNRRLGDRPQRPQGGAAAGHARRHRRVTLR